MRQIGLGSYGKRVSRAAETLLEHQGFDGGWGLTLTSVSSIVNTCEALTVLRAADIAGKPVRDALGFLAAAVEEHCRPRQKGGRGEHTRFVCFGLHGLLGYPQFFTQPGIADAAVWCVDWLERHRVEQGWPEIAGVDDAIVHYRHRYAVAGTHLVLTDWYLYYCLTCPAAEARRYAAQIADWAGAGGWACDGGGESWRLGDLRARVTRYTAHPEDAAVGRSTWTGFESVEMVFSSDGLRLPPGTTRLPWEVLASGIRVPARRGDPVITPTLGPLIDYLPCQAEIGCGLSVEAGIPPLHRLHQIYSVRHGSRPGAGERFVLSPADDVLLREVLTGTERKLALGRPRHLHLHLRRQQRPGRRPGSRRRMRCQRQRPCGHRPGRHPGK